jgi:glycosyltransferase involved in cell wall biosynthesis
MAREHNIMLIRKHNGGQSSARNMGVQNSTSSLIAFLDQDDGWYPRHLEMLARPFQKNHHGLPLAWVYSNLDVVDEQGRMVWRNYATEIYVEHPKRHLTRCLSEDMHILPSATMIRRDAFESVGGFDERLSGYEDDDLFLRLFCDRWNNIFLPESLSFWRRNPSSAAHSPRMATSRMIYAHKLLNNFPDNPTFGWFFGRDYIAPRFFFKTLLPIFTEAVQRGDREVIRRIYADMQEFTPFLGRRARLVMRMLAPMTYSPAGLRMALRGRRILRRIGYRK